MTDLILNKKVFKSGMLKLEAAYRKKTLSKETLKIYYNKLKLTTDADFLAAISNIIDKERWFPVIAVFKEYLAPPRIHQEPIEEMFSNE